MQLGSNKSAEAGAAAGTILLLTGLLTENTQDICFTAVRWWIVSIWHVCHKGSMLWTMNIRESLTASSIVCYPWKGYNNRTGHCTLQTAAWRCPFSWSRLWCCCWPEPLLPVEEGQLQRDKINKINRNVSKQRWQGGNFRWKLYKDISTCTFAVWKILA